MTPFEVNAIAAAVVTIVVLMWVLTLIEFGLGRRVERSEPKQARAGRLALLVRAAFPWSAP